MRTAVPGRFHVHRSTLSFAAAELPTRYSLPSCPLPGTMCRQRQHPHLEPRNRHHADGHLSGSLRELRHDHRDCHHAYLPTPMCL